VQLLHLQKENPGSVNDQLRNQYNERLNRASENVLETMEDLLLWSKSQMTNFTPQNKTIKIAPLLMQEKEFFEEQIKEKNLRLYINVSPEIFQNTDENFIAVILRNLIQNAIKQCDGKATITITADSNTISITNPSPNKNAVELNLILQQTLVNSKYSGLGLQIVKDLATRLGLKIFYKQEDDQNISAVLSWG